VNVFRYETKTTRPFLRVREIHFFEEHTCQTDDAAATARVRSNLGAFRKMAEAYALPYVSVRRPDWDKFPGAYYSVAFDIPVGGARTLQIGTVHHYRDNFAGPYGIRYETADGAQQLAHQTTFGLSERLLGAIVAVHGDQKGVVFPSTIAPYEVVIVPIPGAQSGDAPLLAARALHARLKQAGRRVHLDAGDERPGAKFYRWELQGVPLRLDVGRRETERRHATAVDRLGRKSEVGFDSLEQDVTDRLADFDRTLFARAQAAFREAFSVGRSLDELARSDRVRLISWCGREECGHRIEKAIDGSLLGVPEEGLPLEVGPAPECIACQGTDGVQWALAGRPI
jgi:prolyl-tRNA synthetase